MVRGLGVDLVRVDRIAHALRNPRFAQRILTSQECERPLDAEYVAGRWAAKEAVAKALGRSLSWHQVEVRGPGLPTVCLDPELGIKGTILVSISHERDHAVAVAIWEV